MVYSGKEYFTEKIEEAISFVDDLYNKEIFGHSGKQFLIEEKYLH